MYRESVLSTGLRPVGAASRRGTSAGWCRRRGGAGPRSSGPGARACGPAVVGDDREIARLQQCGERQPVVVVPEIVGGDGGEQGRHGPSGPPVQGAWSSPTPPRTADDCPYSAPAAPPRPAHPAPRPLIHQRRTPAARRAAPRPAENGSWPSCPAAQLPSCPASEPRRTGEPLPPAPGSSRAAVPEDRSPDRARQRASAAGEPPVPVEEATHRLRTDPQSLGDLLPAAPGEEVERVEFLIGQQPSCHAGQDRPVDMPVLGLHSDVGVAQPVGEFLGHGHRPFPD